MTEQARERPPTQETVERLREIREEMAYELSSHGPDCGWMRLRPEDVAALDHAIERLTALEQEEGGPGHRNRGSNANREA